MMDKEWLKLLKTIKNGSNDISTLDPFFEIDPVENEMRQDDDGNIIEVCNIEDEE